MEAAMMIVFLIFVILACVGTFFALKKRNKKD